MLNKWIAPLIVVAVLPSRVDTDGCRSTGFSSAPCAHIHRLDRETRRKSGRQNQWRPGGPEGAGPDGGVLWMRPDVRIWIARLLAVLVIAVVLASCEDLTPTPGQEPKEATEESTSSTENGNGGGGDGNGQGGGPPSEEVTPERAYAGSLGGRWQFAKEGGNNATPPINDVLVFMAGGIVERVEDLYVWDGSWHTVREPLRLEDARYTTEVGEDEEMFLVITRITVKAVEAVDDDPITAINEAVEEVDEKKASVTCQYLVVTTDAPSPARYLTLWDCNGDKNVHDETDTPETGAGAFKLLTGDADNTESGDIQMGTEAGYSESYSYRFIE